ncbi:MAG: hypothetical protein H6652_23550 [Ardenticatenaceae bacterium]|nr:hypothetical protein [Ardenticatenaceae bacterium]
MLQGERQRLALQEIVEEVDNMRVAWWQAVKAADTAVAIQFFQDTLQTVFHVYDMQSWFREGVELFQRGCPPFVANSLTRSSRYRRVQVACTAGLVSFSFGPASGSAAAVAAEPGPFASQW